MGFVCFFSNVCRSKVSAPILINNSFATKEMTMANEQSLGSDQHRLYFGTGQTYCDIASPTTQCEKRSHNPCCVISSNDRYGEPKQKL